MCAYEANRVNKDPPCKLSIILILISAKIAWLKVLTALSEPTNEMALISGCSQMNLTAVNEIILKQSVKKKGKEMKG